MNKRHIEILIWAGAFLLFPLILVTNELIENNRDGLVIVYWRPFLTEYSSAFVALMLVPAVLYFDHRFPIASRNWYWRILVHLPLSILFSVLHISGMFAIRKIVYGLMGEKFSMDSLGWVFLYEYRKDLGTYVTLLFVIYAYREIIRLRLGEAQLIRQEETNKEQILVSKRGIYHFVEGQDIDWVEAAGNYVELHVGSETFMLRSTMKKIEKRLGTERFVRIHRSTLVNRCQISGVTIGRGGERKLTLKAHETVFTVSRNYRSNLVNLPKC